MDVKKGLWTQEEDLKLRKHVTIHGEGHWTFLARSAGLKRSGKSCRLRWLNYLKPDVRRGNITLQEQLLILQLHLRFGNRWSKIAEYLPGRTDNEIKNYWRTRVQKQAKQLNCDVNSPKFRHTLCYSWLPRLAEQIEAIMADHNYMQTTINTAGLRPAPVDTIKESPPNLSDSMTSDCYNYFQDGQLVYNLDCSSLNKQTVDDDGNTLLISDDDYFELFQECHDIWDILHQQV